MPLGFADELRVGLRGMVRRVWGRRGVKVRQRLQLTYKWRYLFLVVDGQKGRLHWTWIDSMTAEKVGAAVNGLKHHTDVAALVWDGAPSHRNELVRGVGLPLIPLPPYSPELNPAERVFEEVRRWIEGKVYPFLEDKVKAVEACLSELESKPDCVRRLANWDWIEAAIQKLPAQIAA
ncbi:MAG: transposase [Dehalococcoidia bacterium]